MSGNLNDIRDRVYPIVDPITRWLVRRGVHTNLITTSGFAFTVLAGFMYGIDHVRTAGFLSQASLHRLVAPGAEAAS